MRPQSPVPRRPAEPPLAENPTSLLGAAIAAVLAIPVDIYLLVRPKNAEGGDWVEDVNQLSLHILQAADRPCTPTLVRNTG
jgi:hypothetical protein